MATFTEKPQSPTELGGTPPRATRLYTLTGAFTGDEAEILAWTSTPATYISSTHGTLYRQDIRLKHAGHEAWEVDATYGKNNRAQGEINWSFDTTGGSIRTKTSLQRISEFQAPGVPASGDKFKGVVNARENQGTNDVEGVDIVVPALKLTTEIRQPAGTVVLAYIKNLARNTGKVNLNAWQTFDAGELLFLGATGRDGTDSDAQISYQFAAAENETGVSIGDIVNISSDGWDVTWTEFEQAVNANGGGGNEADTKPKRVYVDRVYPRVDFASFLGF